MNLLEISYNHLNLPIFITFPSSGKIKRGMEYLYDASGAKKKKTYNYVGRGVARTDTVDYLDGFQYKNGVLQFFPTSEGYAKAPQLGDLPVFSYIYNYTDHLGNVRLSYGDTDRNGSISPVDEIVEENNYYAFGMKHEGYNYNAGDGIYKYKYNGKEFQGELGLNLYDYGARNYDPAIGRWMNIDPLAEEMRRWSPYNYVFNNPMNFVDPDGMSPDNDYRLNRNGSLELTKVTDDNFDKISNSDNSKSIQIDKGIISNSENFITTDKYGGMQANTSYKITNDAKNVTTNLFEFMASNTSVEFQMQLYKTDNTTVGFVSTGYSDENAGMSGYRNASNILGENKNAKLLKDVHSHVYYDVGGNYPIDYPSGFTRDGSLLARPNGKATGDRGYYSNLKTDYGNDRLPSNFEVYNRELPTLKIYYNDKTFSRLNTKKN